MQNLSPDQFIEEYRRNLMKKTVLQVTAAAVILGAVIALDVVLNKKLEKWEAAHPELVEE